MKCVVCKEDTVELSKNIPLHGKCRKEVKGYADKLAEKTAKDVYEKMEGSTLFENYDEILATARKAISTKDTLIALQRGEFNED